MTVQVTILGLGQIGGSVGLALAVHKEKITRVGHDPDFETARAAKKKNVVDSLQANLHSAVEGADLVLLTMPLGEVQDTLKLISADLKEGALVLDTSPARRQGEAWARELLPAGRYYIGLVPAINPGHLLEPGAGLEHARADLLQGANCLVCTSPGLPEKAVRLATDLLQLLGATAILCDATEADGLLTTMSLFPRILGIPLVAATMDKPGWMDARQLAGPAYAMPVAAAFDRELADDLGKAALANRDNLVRLLDLCLESLHSLRDSVQNEKAEELENRILAAQEKAFPWLAEHHLERYDASGDSGNSKDPGVPSFGERLKQSFLGGLSKPRQ